MQRSIGSRNIFRKLVVNGVNDSKTAIQNDCLMRLYDADSELKAISSELDSFDGKKDPVRCNLLVNQLRTAQDKVISLLFQLMDDCNCERASRDYRMKFPDEILLSEGSESLNGQIWFGAECLSAGSNILNHNKESTMLRPMAKTLTQHLDSLRNDLRDLVVDGGGAMRINEALIKKMVAFDRIFATFEYEYVRTMLPIRTTAEIEKLQEVAVLFSETLIDCLKRGLIKQEDIDEFQPIVMIAIPRLAIVRGLLYKNENPIYTRHKSQMCSLFQPFHGPLHSIRKLLRGLHPNELYTLEKMLANDQSASNENEITKRIYEEKEPKAEDANNKTIVSIADGAKDQVDNQDVQPLEAGTSSGNYTNVLMDGLQYPVGHKRASLDEEQGEGYSEPMAAQSPSHQQQEEFNCYLEVQASSSKSNNDDQPSTHEHNSSIPSPSTSFTSPTSRRKISDDTRCSKEGVNDMESGDREDGCRLDGYECDTDDCCLSPRESDAQLERLIANFSPLMSDEPRNSGPCQDVVIQSQEDRECSGSNKTETTYGAAVEEKQRVIDENEAELEELFQKQAQQFLHRLFVAISGVADQLQSNFASDLRFILRHIFSSEIAGENSDDDPQDEHDNAYDEAYEDEEEYGGEYSNEQSDSSLPIEQGIEARETNLIDLDSGYTLMDAIDRASLYPPESSPNQSSYPFGNPTAAGPPVEQNYSPSSQAPPSQPSSHSAPHQRMSVESTMSPSNQQSNLIHNQNNERMLQEALNQRQMNQDLLTDLMRATNQQNLIYGNQDSPNEPSIMENSQHHQRLMQQHLQSVSRATNRIQAAAAAASAATNSGYGRSAADSNSSNYPHQNSSTHRSSHGERRSRHHGSSRSRRVRGPPVWVPDQDVIQCSSCNAPFTLFRRRHHCRACGHIFCAECSKFTKYLNCWGYHGPVRVCEPCYNLP